MNDTRKNGKRTTGKSLRQFRSPGDWDVPVTTSLDPVTADAEDAATFEIPSIDKIVTKRLNGIDQVATMQLPAIDMPGLSFSTELRAIRLGLPSLPQEVDGDWADAATWIMPAIPKSATTIAGATAAVAEKQAAEKKEQTKKGAGGYISLAVEMVKSSGIYAISAMMSPLSSLILTPYLTRTLSKPDLGALLDLYIIIDLISTITQLGLSSAFFRAYNKDYETPRDRAGVLANTILLLALASLPAAIGIVYIAPFLSQTFLKSTAYSGPVMLTGIIIVAENLSFPASSWFQAEKRPIPFTCLSIAGTVLGLLMSIVLVGVLHMGVIGALIAKSIGYFITIAFAYPQIFLRLVRADGLGFRLDIAKSMLTFGIPTLFGDIASWVLQASDSWLLTLIGAGIDQSAEYRVAYVLGGVLSPVLLAPWGLAWRPIMYSLSKREDAPRIYGLVFRWWSTILLFGAFGLSLVSILVLDIFYDPSYRVGAAIIPLITLSTMLQGIWYMFMIGVNIRRKTGLEFMYMVISASINLICNLILIPRYGEMGAAVSTLIAYVVLATVSYIVNRRIYPIDFGIGSFLLKLFIGIALYLGGRFLVQGHNEVGNWLIILLTLLLYGILLLALGGLTPKKIMGLVGFVQHALRKEPNKASV
ncbi:lipopolysaccharide biosynthesis protein [Reticulibacter mediterranei]|uniref:lipopolysaccharide biosynthesis protein n=1 Tax=Reticulibacter mediterranei TaxID=2778369 RepID=UPI001C691022|nr:lipopolysaccharide biosynthesis protein [Reticulibacter mediterranei]